MTRRQKTSGPLPLLPAILLALSLTGCGGKPEPAASAAQDAKPAAAAPPADPAAEAAALDQGPRASETMSLSEPLAATGEALFDARGCTGCHEMGSSENAPDLRGVTARRTEAWLLRQVTAPEWMAEHDALTRSMVEQYGVPMADLGVTADEAAALVQFMLREDGAR